MPDFIAGERGAGLGVTGGGLSLESPIRTHSGVPRQDFNASPEKMNLVCLFNPALPAGELSALSGEETVG